MFVGILDHKWKIKTQKIYMKISRSMVDTVFFSAYHVTSCEIMWDHVTSCETMCTVFFHVEFELRWEWAISDCLQSCSEQAIQPVPQHHSLWANTPAAHIPPAKHMLRVRVTYFISLQMMRTGSDWSHSMMYQTVDTTTSMPVTLMWVVCVFIQLITIP